MFSVASSNIEKIGYDEKTKTLRVVFKGGAIYDYTGVPLSVFQGFKMSLSIGTFLRNNIAKVYPYKKVDEIEF